MTYRSARGSSARFLRRTIFAAVAGAIVGSSSGSTETSWAELIRGENLARRARLSATEAPYFPKGGAASLENLQDGAVAPTPAHMRSSSFAVHWRGTGHVFVRVDLPRTTPVERIAIRVLGGRAEDHLIYPRAISAWLSSDGATWQCAGEAERERDFPVELGKARVAAIAISAHGTPARNLILHFTLASEFLFVDEIAVIRSPNPPPAAASSACANATPLHAGLAAFPDKREILTSTPSLPNFLTLLQDGARRPRGPLAAWFDLPSGVTLRGAEKVGKAPGLPERTRYRAEIAHPDAGQSHTSRAVFFEGRAPSGSMVRITPTGRAAQPVEVPLRAITVPATAAPRSLHVSLGWLRAETAAQFPDVIGTLRSLGFNGFGVFPRYWARGLPSRQEAAWIEAARMSGMDIIYNESPFHVMEQRRRGSPEIRTQRPGGIAGPGVSPCYRGKYYAEELARIEALARKLRPQWVFFDSELWTNGAREAGVDAQCARLSGSPRERETALLSRAGGEIARDLRRAIQRAVPEGKVHAGLYAVEPTHIYQGLFDFGAVSSNGIDLAMPSLYTSGDPQAVRDRITGILAKQPETFVLPWLTAGTLGEYPSRYLRASLLEAFFSGARGITYFQAEDFDTPEDFLAHAQAIAVVSRYEDYFTRGSADQEVRVESGDASVIARALESRLLVLLGSYRSRATEQVKVALGCRVPWRDVETNATHGTTSLAVALQPGDSRVFECSQVAGGP